MERTVQHTLHVSLGFDETCERIERRRHQLLDRATTVATEIVTRGTTERSSSSAQPPVWVVHRPLRREADHHATMALDWQTSAPSGRLLPHLDARLVVNGVIVRRPHASTAVSILGSFDLSAGLLHRIDDLLFGRRLVNDATAAFLDAFVDGLLEHSIDLRAENAATSVR
jgi:hypothetical protein